MSSLKNGHYEQEIATQLQTTAEKFKATNSPPRWTCSGYNFLPRRPLDGLAIQLQLTPRPSRNRRLLTCTIGELCCQIRETEVSGELPKRPERFSVAADICLMRTHSHTSHTILVGCISGCKSTVHAHGCW